MRCDPICRFGIRQKLHTYQDIQLLTADSAANRHHVLHGNVNIWCPLHGSDGLDAQARVPVSRAYSRMPL